MLTCIAALGRVGEKKEPQVVGIPAPRCHSLSLLFPSSPEPLERWEGSQPLTVPRKTAEWEDLETFRPSALLCWAEAGAQGQEERGPQTYCKLTVFGGEQTSWPNTSNQCWVGRIKRSFSISFWHPWGIQSFKTSMKVGSPPQACFYGAWVELPFRSSLLEKCRLSLFHRSMPSDGVFCRGLQMEPLLSWSWLSGVSLSRKAKPWHIFPRSGKV